MAGVLLGDYGTLVGAKRMGMDTSTDPARVIRYRTRNSCGLGRCAGNDRLLGSAAPGQRSELLR